MPKQRGAILIIALIFMSAMLFLGLSAMNASNLQMSLVGDLNDQALAEQKADFAIANAKKFIVNGLNTTGQNNNGLEFEKQPCPLVGSGVCTSNTTCSGSGYFYASGNFCYDTSDNSNNQFNNMFLNSGYHSVFLDFPVSGSIEPASHVIQAYCSENGSSTNNNPSIRYIVTGQGKGRYPGTFASKKAVFRHSNFREINDQSSVPPTKTGANIINVTITHNVPIDSGPADSCYNIYKASQVVTLMPMSRVLIYHGQCRNNPSKSITTTSPRKFDFYNYGCGAGAGHVASAYCRMDARGNVQVYAYSPDSGKTNAAGACMGQFGNWVAYPATSTVTLYSSIDLNLKTFTCRANEAPFAGYLTPACNNSP